MHGETRRLSAIGENVRCKRVSGSFGFTVVRSGNISGVHGERAGVVACSPHVDATLGLCMLSGDEAKHHVQVAHREEEKCSDEHELANMVGANCSSDAKWGDHTQFELSCDKYGKKEGETYSPWKILSEPRPNCERSTGKKQSKKDIGQEISDRTRKTSWKMMKRRLTTAQKTPAGRLGMVLPLEKLGQHDPNIRVVHKGDERTLHNRKFCHWHVDHVGPC